MVLLHLDAFVGQNLTFSHQISVQLKTSEHFRAHFFVFRAQFLTKRRHFRPDPFLSCAERWQDLRAVRDSRGPCSEKRPFLARSSRGVSSDGDLRGISDAWRAYPARASPFSDAWRANLAANWRFSRPRPLSGCMERKTCHGLPPGDAPRRNPATARHSRTHRARILPLPVRPRVHQGAILPPSDAGGTHRARILPLPVARERISRISCHCLGMHSVDILPSADIRECAVSAYLHCRSSGRATFSTRGSGFRPLAALWGSARNTFCAREWAFRLLGA